MQAHITVAAVALVAGVLVGASAPGQERDDGSPPVTDERPAERRGEGWAAFELSSLEERRREGDTPWLEFLAVPSLSAGVYTLAAGAEDAQSPHEQDEVYHVVAGRAVLALAATEVAVEPGSVVYVAAGVPHRFQAIEEELRVLVFFAAAPETETR